MPAPQFDDSLLKDIQKQLQDLLDEYNKFKDQVIKTLKDLQDQINGKADIEALQDLERMLLNRLDEFVRGLTKKLADKNETKRSLKALEK